MAATEKAPLVAVLAAGRASRFGGGKLDADCAGKPVGQWVLDAVADAGLPKGVIVLGEDYPEFAKASGWDLLLNRKAEEGLGTSLALAASRALVEQRALLIVLADMPLVSPAHLAALAGPKALAATAYPGGGAGVPALFPRECLELLSTCTGDGGAGKFLNSANNLHLIPATESELFDVDTESDLKGAQRVLSARG